MTDYQEPQPQADPRLLWQAAATAYLGMMEEDTGGLNGAEVRRQCLNPWLLGRLCRQSFRRALDLGCGEGWLSRWLAARGGQVCGIDLAWVLVRTGSALSAFAGLSYVQGDVSALLPYATGSFDLVVANLLMHWLPNLDAAMAELARVMNASATAVITISHPYFVNKAAHWQLDDPDGPVLLTRNMRPRPITTFVGTHSQRHRPIGPLTYFHRLVSDYFTAFRSAGFEVIGLEELFCPNEVLQLDPQWIRHTAIPLFIGFELRKGSYV